MKTASFARTVLVRPGFSEEDVWRQALGGPESLLVFTTYGPIGAPDWLPAGSSYHSRLGGVSTRTVQRSDQS